MNRDPQNAVTLNAVQKCIEDLKPILNKIRETGLDEPWSLGTLEKHPLPSEAILHILKVQEANPYFKVTIRQAKWISHLYKVIKDTKMLSQISFNYTFHEKISKISQTQFDTSKYDVLLHDPAKHKQLIKLFSDIQKDVDWLSRKKIHKEMTGVPMAEPILEIAFRGNEAFGILHNEPDVNFGPRDKFIQQLMDDGEIRKSEKLPGGDFNLRLKTKIIYLKEEDL